MSDITASLGMTLDSSGVVTGSNTARDAIAGLVTSAQQSFYGLSQIGNGLKQIGDSLTGLAENIVTSATNIQAAQERVTTQIYNFNASQSQNAATNDAMASSAVNLAKQLAVPIPKLQELEAQVASFGIHAKSDIEGVSTIITQLAYDTNTSATQIAAPFNRTAELFNINATQSQGLANAIRSLSTQITGGADAFLLQIDRTAGLAQSLGLTTNQSIAFAAEVADLDGRVRGAGQTFQIFGKQVFDAVQQGGERLTALASLSHESTDAFKQDWATDRYGAIQKVLEGFAQIPAAERQTVEANLGITGQQAQAFDLLATAATRPGKSLQDFAQIAQQAFSNSSQLATVYAGYLGTTAAKEVQLKDEIQKFSDFIGKDVLPIVNSFLGAITQVIDAVQSIPGGAVFLEIGVVLAALVGTLATVGGAILLIGTRVLIAKAAWDTYQISLIRASSAQAAVAQEIVAGDAQIASAQESMSEAIISSNAAVSESFLVAEESTSLFYARLGLTAEHSAYIAASQAVVVANQEIAASDQEVIIADQELVTANQEVEASSIGLAGAMSTAVPVIGAVIILFENFVQGAAKAKSAIDAFANSVAQKEGNSSLADLNAQIDQLQTKMKNLKAPGPGIVDDLAGPIYSIIDSNHKLSASQNEVNKKIQDLRIEISNVTKVAADFGITFDAALKLAASSGITNLTGSLQDIERRIREAQTSASSSLAPGGNIDTQKTQKEIDAQSQALINYEKELHTVQDSTLSVANAQTTLATALRDVANEGAKAADAQRKIQEAQIAVQTSAITVLQDQIKVQFAAQDQAFALMDAERALADAKQRVVDNTNNVAKAEKALQDLNSIDYEIQYAQAINSVADAQLKLRNEQASAASAAYNLRYIQQEGGSPADIAKAQRDLADANQKVTDTTTNLAAAQNKVDSLPADHAQQLADATLALANARNQASVNTENFAKAEEALQKQQILSANNVDIRSATLALQDARLKEKDATYGVLQAEENLKKVQDGSTERALASATMALTNALWAQAEARTKATVDFDAMKGHIDNAQQQAHILAQNLIDVGWAGHNMQLVAAGNDIMNNLNTPLLQAGWSAEMLALGLQNVYATAGAAQGAINSGNNYAAQAQAAYNKAHGYARGGIISQDEFAMLHAPEVVIPLNDMSTAMSLLQQTGLINMITASVPQGSLTPSSNNYISNSTRQGSTYQLTAITSADPREIVDAFMWNEDVSLRS